MWVMEFLEFSFMQRALVACIAICAAAPLAGTFVVQRGQSLVGDGMGHVAVAGVGAAFLLDTSPLLGAGVICVLAAATLVRAEKAGLGTDLALALVFYGGTALGYLLLLRSGVGVNRLLGVLFGSPLTLDWSQGTAIVALSVAVAALVVALHTPLLSVTFDEASARVAGVPADRLVLTLTVLVALVVVGGMHTLGLLLVAAMLVVPVAAAAQVTGSCRATMGLASAIGALSAAVGLVIAFHADLSPGAAIVLTTLGCHVALASARPLLRRIAQAGERLVAARRNRAAAGSTAEERVSRGRA